MTELFQSTNMPIIRLARPKPNHQVYTSPGILLGMATSPNPDGNSSLLTGEHPRQKGHDPCGKHRLGFAGDL